MLRLGLHVSIQVSIDRAADRAAKLGCNTFQLFTRNPRGWSYRKLKTIEVESFIRKVKAFNLWPIYAHMPYLTNLASPKDSIYRRSTQSLVVELERSKLLKIPFVVTHLGSHLGVGYSYGEERIVSAINEALSKSEGDVIILLENSAGTRNSLGSHFSELGDIIAKIEDKNRVGVCFDTCHGFAAGYDLKSWSGVEETISELEREVGFEKLKVVHINDSKGDFASGIDRHEHIGLGKIGEEGFKNILRSRFGDLPLILETPVDDRRSDLENLLKVRQLYKAARSDDEL